MKKLIMGIILSLLFLNVSHSYANYWARTYGGSETDSSRDFLETSDGGYLVIGSTASYGAGNYDLLLIKLDADGTTAWQKTYGGSAHDLYFWKSCIQETDDGFILVATSYSGDTHMGGGDLWVLKLDANGGVQWQKTYGGSGAEEPKAILKTDDEGYLVAGATRSFGAGSTDAWLLKLFSNGTIEWQKVYGWGGYDLLTSIHQTADGGYIAGGYTKSQGLGGDDAWVLKLDSNGNDEWQKIYGLGSGDDVCFDIQITSDEGYILAGFYTGPSGKDGWIFKLNPDGTIDWEKAYQQSSYDEAYYIQQTDDGGYIVVGYTGTQNNGGSGIWVLKLNSDGTINWEKTYGGTEYETGHYIHQIPDGGYLLSGQTQSYGEGINDILIMKLDSKGEIPDCELVDISNTSVTDVYATVINPSCTITPTSVSSPDANISYQDVSTGQSVLCEALIQEFTCVGFEPPMDKSPITVKKNRVLPLKAQLIDADGFPVTDLDIVALPVLQVLFNSEGEPLDVSDDALPAGHGTDGNQFVFTDEGKWQFNLKTKNYTAAGTYSITMVSGDETEYVIEPKCEATFVIQE